MLLLLAGFFPGRSQAQCFDNSNGNSRFRVYDASTRLEVSTLCVGQTYRLKDASGRSLSPSVIYYVARPAITCSFAPTDTATFYTPTAAGSIVITQLTPNLVPAAPGFTYPRPFAVKALPRPAFTLTVCAPGFVQVTIDDRNYDQYFVQLGTGARQPAQATPYAVGSGVTTVTVIGKYTGGCEAASTRSFTPKPAAVRPLIRQLDAQDGRFVFQFGPLQADYQYQLQQADAATPGGFRTVAPITAGQTSYTLAPAPAAGCYRLLLTDACQPSISNLPSGELCSVQLTGTSNDGRNLLSWTPRAGYRYVLRREGIILPPGSSPYLDSVGITCGVSYRYRLEATTGTGATAAVSTSEVSVLTSALRTQPVPRLFATFTARNQVELTATVPGLPTGGQLLYRRDNTLTVATTPSRTVRDSTVTSLIEPVCYTVQFLDACGNSSAASAGFCPVVLRAAAADAEGTQAQLSWSALRSPAPASSVRYLVQVQQADNSWRDISGSLTAPEFLDLQPPTDRQVLRYRIAASGAGQPVSYSNIATVARQFRVFLPTAFSPNGDRLNDVLEVKGRFLTTFRFTVVDRNGQEVFRGTDRTQTWDGRISSAPPVPGPYVWRFEATDETGQRVVQHGTITIVR
ncbi:hypothetical protein GCM10022408_04700 [Hymenobacter fastidiosus]|uniref:Gliding motility-associated C-terminal domain-containing protein n=1 Tax=Hymenobacter fastidiosus TaxID=486264 RepID=A0ABP7RGC8_9BACT